jgi:ABC-type transporter Mla MlaB component
VQPSQSEIIQQDNHRYQITGTIDFATVPALMQRVLQIFRTHRNTGTGKVSDVVFDLSRVSDCNSAGLALMLEMSKDAQSNNIQLHFDNLPASLLTIANAYGVESEIRDIC